MPTFQEMLNQVSPITGSIYDREKPPTQPKKIGFLGKTKSAEGQKPKKAEVQPASTFAQDTYAKPAPTPTEMIRQEAASTPFALPFDLIDPQDVTERIKAVQTGFRAHKGYSPDPDTVSRFVFSEIPTKDLPKMFRFQPKRLMYDVDIAPSKESDARVISGDVALAFRNKTIAKLHPDFKPVKADLFGDLLAGIGDSYALWAGSIVEDIHNDPSKAVSAAWIKKKVETFPDVEPVVRTYRFMKDADYRESMWQDNKAGALVDGIASLAILIPVVGKGAKVLKDLDGKAINELIEKIPPHTRRIITRAMLAPTGVISSIPGGGGKTDRYAKAAQQAIPRLEEKIKLLKRWQQDHLDNLPASQLIRDIKEHGGIRIDKEAYAGIDPEEINKIIPVGVRGGKTAQSVDEMAQALGFERSDELVEELRSVAQKRESVTDFPFADQLERYERGLERLQERTQGIVRVKSADPIFEEDVIIRLDELKKYPAVRESIEGIEKYFIDAEERRLEFVLGKAPKQPGLGLETHRDIAEEAARVVTANPDSPIAKNTSDRLFRRIADELELGNIHTGDIPTILKTYNLTPRQFADVYMNDISTSARKLAELSKVSRELKKLFPDELKDLPDTPPTVWEMIKNTWVRVDNIRRASLVSQVATAVRNAISQTGRYSLNIFDDALAGTFEVVSGQSASRAFAPMFEDVAAAVRRLTPKGRKRLTEILNSNALESAQLFNAPVQDVTLGSKYARALNTLNSGQEFVFRKAAFDARFTANLKRAGITDPADATQEILEDAVKFALDLTFASNPASGTLGSALMGMYEKMPFLTLVNPFPRFMANGMRFLYEFSPVGYARLLTPQLRKAMASGDKRVAAEALSKATIGTMMLGAAIGLRKSEYAGEKWNEVEVNGKTYNLRAFGPFVTYAFAAEVILNPDKLEPADYAGALLSLNSIGGTGLALIDMLRTKDATGAKKIAERIAGEWVGGFAVPLITATDVLGQWNKEERTLRDTREQPLTAPFLSKVPFIKERLPKVPRADREGYYETENPLIRQVTGLTVKTKTQVEKELDRLNVENYRLRPRTGSPALDRAIIELTAPDVNKWTAKLIASPEYKGADDETKKLLIFDLVGEIKKAKKPEAVYIYMVDKLDDIKSQEKQWEYVQEMDEAGHLNKGDIKRLLETAHIWEN